jgi:hypothetical protein
VRPPKSISRIFGFFIVSSAIAGSAMALELDVTASPYGAKGDGSDATEAFTLAINQMNADEAKGYKDTIKVPAGIYTISSALPALVGPGSFIGDGPHSSYIVLSSSFSGDLFAWDESWVGRGGWGTYSLSASSDQSGPSVKGISVLGTAGSGPTQNAFAFYDRNDFVVMRDVEVYYLNGSAISIGKTKTTTQAYMRESEFSNVKVWNSGQANVPAVLISSTTTSGSDATNELKFYSLNIFSSAGPGLVISNPNAYSATRLIEFYGLRVEDSQGGDNVDIGLASDQGTVADIQIFGMENILAPSGYASVKIASGASIAPYGISIRGGAIGPAAGNGIVIDNGSALLDVPNIGVSGTNLIVGASAQAVTLPQNAAWVSSTSVASNSLAVRSPYSLSGNPVGAAKVGSYVMSGKITGSSAVRLTSDGSGVANANNCFNIPVGTIANITVSLVAHDTTSTANWYSWTEAGAVFAEPYGTSGVTFTAGSLGASHASAGTGSTASVSASADTTNGCLNITVSPPLLNSDTWSINAKVDYVYSN